MKNKFIQSSLLIGYLCFQLNSNATPCTELRDQLSAFQTESSKNSQRGEGLGNAFVSELNREIEFFRRSFPEVDTRNMQGLRDDVSTLSNTYNKTSVHLDTELTFILENLTRLCENT